MADNLRGSLVAFPLCLKMLQRARLHLDLPTACLLPPFRPGSAQLLLLRSACLVAWFGWPVLAAVRILCI